MYNPERVKQNDEAIARMDHGLTNQPPANELVVSEMQRIRASAKQLGIDIIVRAPESRERSVALTKLEETVMWAIKAIAVNQ